MKKIALSLLLAATTSLMADGAALFKKCASCHGQKAEKHALNKSKIINEMASADIKAALHGYKDGSYGGPMKGIMKGQVAPLSDADIDALAAYIPTLK